ncbi:porin family protein [candidate division KSB1 bacterium]|nr:porin family protein [candidate division KSB1 bacterium]
MKRLFTLIAFALLLSTAAFGQNISFGIHAGYSMTAFDWEKFIGLDDADEAGNLLVGVEAGYLVGTNLEVGLGFNYVLPYPVEITSEDPDEDFISKATLDINQQVALLFAKYHLGMGSTHPYLKAGLGYYFGDTDVKYEFEDETYEETVKIDPALGINVGAGLQLNNLFVDFEYHIVERTWSDIEDDEAAGMNTWNVRLGYRF